MSGLVQDFETLGYRFRLEGERLFIEGPPELLHSDTLAQLRARKPQLLAELRRREAFIQLVRSVAACEHQILLARREILAELDEADLAELQTNTPEDRRAWAEGLAYRLTRHRIAS